MRAKVIILFLVMTFEILGCAAPTKYYWGNYENCLYSYYKNPSEVEEIVEALSKIIKNGEQDGRVPPGIYADYGYLLFVTGKTGEAIVYFEKEKNAWPESSMLMDKMITTVKADEEKKYRKDDSRTPSGESGQ